MVKQPGKNKASKPKVKKIMDKHFKPQKSARISGKRKKRKEGTSDLGSLIDVPGFNEEGLDKIPKQKKKSSAKRIGNGLVRSKKRKAGHSNEFLTAKEIDEKIAAKNELRKRRLSRNRKTLFGGLIFWLSSVLIRRKSKRIEKAPL